MTDATGAGLAVAPRPRSATSGALGPRLRTAVAGSVAGKAVEMATLVLLATVVPRVLGPDAYGRFAVPLTIVTLGSLALTLGGPTLLARYVPAAPPERRVALARAIGGRLARGRAIQLAAMAAATAVAVALAPARLDPTVTVLVGVALALNVATSLLLQVALGLGRTGAWSTRYPLQNAVLVAAVLVLEPRSGEVGAAAALVVAAAVATTFAVVVFRSAAPRPDGAPEPIPTGAIRFGVLQAAGAGLVQVAQRGGVLAVALLAGSAVETGYSALAIGIALGATYAILQAFTVTLPHLSDGAAVAGTAVDVGLEAVEGAEVVEADAARRWGRRGVPSPDGIAAEATLRRMATVLVAVLVPVSLVVALVLPDAVPVVFGPDYRGAASSFAPALALVVLAPLNALVVQVSALRVRPEVSALGGTAAVVAFVVTCLVAVPAWGGAGGTAGALAGAVAAAAVAVSLLAGAAGTRLVALSAAGTAVVLAVAVLAA